MQLHTVRDSSCFWGVHATRNIVHHHSHLCQESDLTLIAITISPFKAQRFMTSSCLLHTSQKSRERNSQKIGTLSAWDVFQVYKGTMDCIRANCLEQSSRVRELQHFLLDCTLQPLHFVLQSLLIWTLQPQSSLVRVFKHSPKSIVLHKDWIAIRSSLWLFSHRLNYN